MPLRNRRAAALPAKLSRSWLLVNAAKPEDFAPGLASEADSVIFDLEAAVPEEHKEQARANVVDALSSGMTAWVRISATTTDHWAEDLEALKDLEGVRGVILAETEEPEQVTFTAMRLRAGTPVIALLESALGVENATAVARAPGTFRLAFGTNDFRKDVGVGDDPIAMAYARSRLVIASRVGGLPGAIDGPPGNTDGEDAVAETSGLTNTMGMTGRLVLSRDQVDWVNKALSPSEDEVKWAHDLLDQHAAGAAVGDGSYLPRLLRARKIADLADSYGLWNA
ncbi:Citrate lyase beta chain [Micrococcus lylae]|uniref:Citrate lyase beta chain n=1 Tax=Micrococcus lylae TaxID=1273 RepID=A0A1R4JPK9_9MICC|nr:MULTISPECIES: CoA ester lyase [Micrococcus]MCT2006373.1 CoA ester lyase [Micrococcus lylae]MCT2072039.1 CoA ester lyase [Micrococcus lylae]OFR88398.1 aldolase [Micrococcus sp. HMSC067E09]PNL18725.1 CoA ester lyase [Micrococcus sp. FDAARGOS_333]TFH98808.1 CoA ester lyase [Micrococcus lylae]